jgi:DNA ligase-1
MNRFAALLDRLAYEPSRNAKLRLLTDYFRETPDPDRGYALAAITGALSFRHAKAGIIRALIAERTDEVLFGLSYDYVGDLSETVALMWPAIPPPKGEGAEQSEAGGALAARPHPAAPRPPSPFGGGIRGRART